MRHDLSKVAYRPEEELSGVKTLVTDKSQDGLPTDIDREQETNLPPGAATPKSVKQDDAVEGHGRAIGQPSYNGPGTGEDGPAEHPRTIGEPGGDVPTKFDYNMPTRRTMTGYTPRKPWKRQKRQPALKHIHDHNYYEQNKSRIKQRLKLWYKGNKHNMNFQTKKEDLRENPNRYKRQRVADTEHEGYTPWSMGKHRHRIRGPAHTKRHRSYIRNRAKAHRQHHIWYQRNKHKPAFQRRQHLRQQHPQRFRMRLSAYVPDVEIWFVYGPSATVAVVSSVSPERVAFEDAWDDSVHDLSPQAFMQAVSFLSEEDMHEMFAVLDEFGGEDPYGEPSVQDLLEVARLFQTSPEDIVAEDPPMSDAVLSLAEQSMEAWDVSDPDMVGRVALQHLAIGEVILFDQRSPEDGNWEKPDSLPSGNAVGPGQWTKADPKTHDPSPGGDIPSYDTTTDFGGGSGKVIPDHLRLAATIADIESKTAKDVLSRAKGVKVRLSRADPKRGLWMFKANGSKGKAYTIRFQAVAAGNTKDVSKLQVRVSCDCDFFRYQGPEHWARTNSYLYGKPLGTASAPTEKDPHGQHWACKHVLSALKLARGYRVASMGWDPVPWYEDVLSRVVARYGAHGA